MRFSLIPKSDGVLFEKSSIHCHAIHCEFTLSPYDDDPSSKDFLDELDHLFIKKYGDNATNYLQLHKKLDILGRWCEDCKAIKILLFGKMLENLVNVLGSKMRIRVEFREMEVKYAVGYTRGTFREVSVFSPDVVSFPPEHVGTTKEMTVDNDPKGSWNTYSCVDHDVQIPYEWKLYMKQSDLGETVFCGQIKIEVSTCGFSYILPSVSEKRIMDLHDTNKKMLDEEILPDAVLVGMTGMEIKCHRNIIAARSPVFVSLFQNDSPVSTSTCNKIEVLEMNDKALNAFLAYLYYGDLGNASENSEIAFELFRAGHKYEIQPLTESAKHIFLNKKKEWIDVTIALRLFLFLGEVGECEQLKAKCAQVMKLKRYELVQSARFWEFFPSDHETAMELCRYIRLS